LLSAEVLIASALILGALLLIPLLAPRLFRFEMAFVLLLFGLGAFGGSEFLRESVRKPYTLYGYMYGNSLRPDEYPVIAEKGGLLPNAIFVKNRQATVSVDAGEDVFRVACRGCHALDGYKGLRDSFSGMDRQFAENVITRLQYMRGKMPPFPGTETEAKALAAWLLAQTDPNYNIANGEEVFSKRCNICHTIDDGYRDLYPMLEPYPAETLLESLPILGSWLPEMVPFSGTPKETEMLTRYIRSWYPPVTDQTAGGE